MSAVSYYLIFPLHLRHQVITITELTENIQCPTNWVKFSISGQLQPYIFNFVKINLIWNMEKIPPQTPVIVNDGSQIDRKSLVPFQLLAYNLVQTKNKTKRLIDAITSNNGYGRKIGLIILPYLLTHLLSYPQSRDAIASKNVSYVDVGLVQSCLDLI